MTTTTDTRTTCLLPIELTQKQKADILAWIRELTNEGRHLEASTLYTQYFGMV